MATASIPKVETPKKAVTQPSNSNSAPESSPVSAAEAPRGGGLGDESSQKPTSGEAKKKSDSSAGEAVTDIEKKIKRAERFGMPVQLSEQEKRSSRAERFGMIKGSESSNQPEELKRKARAERFGIVQPTPADDEARKKARLARFGSVANVDEEEDKRKARAIRFSQPHSGPLSQANGLELKKASTGQVGGET